MYTVKLLDCTLREAPVEGLQFSSLQLKRYYQAMTKTGVDIIECGFLKDVEYKQGSTVFSSVEDIQPYLPAHKKNSIFVALMDYGRFSLERLSDFSEGCIDGIRICFKKHEWRNAIVTAKRIKDKGYRVFFQHVDTLSFSTDEMLSLLEKVNELQPYAYSIVDTFGSMYVDDLHRLFNLVNGHLNQEILLGFHSHNNLMMANALSQEFTHLAKKVRNIMIDSSMMGAGRGAGNAHLELIAAFLNKKYDYNYNLNEILDIIDGQIPRLMQNAKWGYSIPYFISGMHSSHVFNVNYLLSRHNIKSKDLTAIIDSFDEKHKKLYDYDYLDDQYYKYFSRPVNDGEVYKQLEQVFGEKPIIVIAPGKTAKTYRDKILKFAQDNDAIIIGVNAIIESFPYDFVFFSNTNRYELAFDTERRLEEIPAIICSNIKVETIPERKEYIIDYIKLIKRGWKNADNAMILLLRFLSRFNVASISIAGFDGFDAGRKENYADDMLSVPSMSQNDIDILEKELKEMLMGIMENELAGVPMNTLTRSKYFVDLGGKHEPI